MPTCRTNDPAQHQPTQHPRIPRGGTQRGVEQSGFNLIELMIVIAIAAIGLSLALPSFTEALQRNRIAAASNEFIAAVMYARSEALQRNTMAGVCASEDQEACSGTWTDGWIVWADINRNDVLDEGEVLRVGAISEGDEMTTTPLSAVALEFNARGMPSSGVTASTQTQFAIEPEECDTGKLLRRELTITITGQIRTASVACS